MRRFQVGILLLFPTVPCSHERNSTKVLLRAFSSEKFDLSYLESFTEQKNHLGKAQRCSPGEDARKEFFCCFSPCSGSHVRYSTKFLLPAFCGEKTDPSHLKSCRAKKPHLGKVQRCSPGEGARQEFSCCFSPCPGSHVRHSTKAQQYVVVGTGVKGAWGRRLELGTLLWHIWVS